MIAKITKRMRRQGYSSMEIALEIREYKWQKANPLVREE